MTPIPLTVDFDETSVVGSRAVHARETGGPIGVRRSSARARGRSRSRLALVGVVAASAALSGVAAQGSANAAESRSDDAFQQVNLVSDLGGGFAQLQDPAVINPWGIAMGPDTPLWVNNNSNRTLATCDETCVIKPADLLTKITLYSGANATNDHVVKVPLEVTASVPTGMVFNPTSSFVINQGGVKTPARFLFNETFLSDVGESKSTITGWSNVPPPPPTTTTMTAATKDPGSHNGLALVPGDSHHGPRLLAADSTNGGAIDVYDATFNKVIAPGMFVDPTIRDDGFVPYNVTFLKDRVYVTYAADDGGNGGALSVFSSNGKFRKRLHTNGPDVGPLNAPWGMTIAPDDWGDFGGAILVGNVNDGMINAFNRRNGHFRGTVNDATGTALANPGLWSLAFGNGTIGTPRTLLFSAGIATPGGDGQDGYSHGLVGLIKPVGE
jgi:uncharacterized protein (TIGR03118 family)